jgi:NADH-quinone oxidoreductase subunit L
MTMVNAAYAIPAIPAFGAILLLLSGRRLREPLSGWFATAIAASSFVATLITFVALLGLDGEERRVTKHVFDWIQIGSFRVDVALLIDPLSITMALFVTGIGSLIHLYSIGYMHGDPLFTRFFAYLNLFIFSMLILVLADNFVLTFLGWEGVGTCSYLLISFWFEKNSAAVAGKKAFVTNRIGDFGFMMAMFLVFNTVGSLRYLDVFEFVAANPLASGTATAIALMLLVAACGKSAQLPLFVWLPDAMEGPTPVSALIHAATMVTAGVFLMARCSPLLVFAPTAMTIIAVVGVATALFAASVAIAQDDIKKVLAYSTVSQLGFMFLAVGSGAYIAALFHMITHAFFKALMFLGSGSVIHGMHHEQDMKKMGALRKLMPLTAITFLVGWLAIAGIPPFSGFWSKDEVLLAAFNKSPILGVLGLITALITAYYMTRQIILVFFGKPRFDEAHRPHESPWTMVSPLVVLAGLATVAGGLNLPFNDSTKILEHWLEPSIVGEIHAKVSGSTKLLLAGAATAMAVVGIAIAVKAWRKTVVRPELEPAVLRNAWYVDAAYAWAVDKPGRAMAQASADVVDAKVIDGAVNGAGWLVTGAASVLRLAQSGYVRAYAGVMVGGIALVLGALLWVR